MIHFRGLVYRAHNPSWAFAPLSGDGARRHGGRFNPVGTPALYTSLTETTALAEYHQGFPHRPQPTTLCAYDVDCEDIADLTDNAQREALDINPVDLGCAWESIARQGGKPPSWVVYSRLTGFGIAGVIVSSYARNSPKDGKNLVFWRWAKTPPHRVVVIDDFGRLPTNIST